MSGFAFDIRLSSVHTICDGDAGRFGTLCLPGAGPAPLDAAQSVQDGRRRGSADSDDHRPGPAIWALRLLECAPAGGQAEGI